METTTSKAGTKRKIPTELPSMKKLKEDRNDHIQETILFQATEEIIAKIIVESQRLDGNIKISFSSRDKELLLVEGKPIPSLWMGGIINELRK